ncbi:hypothetical protein HYX13_00215 [Candidatus Woesearchaeota archaeon]|nr:hypothetical protein [Candidatus Woesearchaeota archaeon]
MGKKILFVLLLMIVLALPFLPSVFSMEQTNPELNCFEKQAANSLSASEREAIAERRQIERKRLCEYAPNPEQCKQCVEELLTYAWRSNNLRSGDPLFQRSFIIDFLLLSSVSLSSLSFLYLISSAFFFLAKRKFLFSKKLFYAVLALFVILIVIILIILFGSSKRVFL